MVLGSKFKIKVLVVDHHMLFAEGTFSILSSSAQISVVGIANTGAMCIDLVLRKKPDVILLGINLSDICGIDLIPEILTIVPKAKIITVTSYNPHESLVKALQKGAQGFLLKDCPKNEMVEAIEQVYLGGNFFSKSMAPFIRHVVVEMAQNAGNNNRRNKLEERLTPREREVLQLMANGLQNKEISAELRIKIRTVDTHVSNIFVKLGVSSRIEAVVVWIKANEDEKLIGIKIPVE